MSWFREHIEKPIIDVVKGKRSKHWRKTRKNHVFAHPECAACGTDNDPEVHHIKDFSTYPELELEPTNLITLCGKRCHILFGHLLSWKSINPTVVEDSTWFFKKVVHRR